LFLGTPVKNQTKPENPSKKTTKKTKSNRKSDKNQTQIL
jgi:hypothetical protein